MFLGGISPDQPAEVGMNHFAAIGGLTENEFSERLYQRISKGNVLDVLRVEFQARLMEWVSSKGMETDGSPFIIVLRLSLNRREDSALFCQCRVDMGGEEAMIVCDEAVPGVINAPPERLARMERFEMSFKNMENEP